VGKGQMEKRKGKFMTVGPRYKSDTSSASVVSHGTAMGRAVMPFPLITRYGGVRLSGVALPLDWRSAMQPPPLNCISKSAAKSTEESDYLLWQATGVGRVDVSSLTALSQGEGRLRMWTGRRWT